MAVLDVEIARYEVLQADLEREHLGKWALISGEELVGVFETFEDAGAVAARRYGRGPYLIRKIGAPPLRLPPRMGYNPALTLTGPVYKEDWR